jgi:ABC-type branched-subunit amino acid transport system substrate-binding protein
MKAKPILILVMTALLLSLVAAACTTDEDVAEPTATPEATDTEVPTQEPEGPIKIGALLGITGGISSDEEQSLMGIEMALDEADYEVAGREIELIVEDVQMDAAICLEKVKKLNEMDNVDLVIGPYLTSQGLAIRDYIDENGLLTISHVCSSPRFIEEEYSDYFFRSSHTSG